jgi:hypothetical protein
MCLAGRWPKPVITRPKSWQHCWPSMAPIATDALRTRRSALLVRVEDVVLRLYLHVTRVSAV